MVKYNISGHDLKVEKATVILNLEDVATLGLHQRVSSLNKFGHNTSVGTSLVDVNAFGDLTEANILDLGEAVAFEMLSSSILDDKDGDAAGAWTVKLTMVNDDGEEEVFELDLDGQTPIDIINPTTTTAIWIHCNRAEVVAWKSGTISNIGNIDIRQDAGDIIHAQIEATENQTLQTLFYVPTIYSHLLIKTIYISTNKNEEAIIRYRRRSAGGRFVTKDILHVINTGRPRNYSPPLKALGGTYVKLTAKGGSPGTEITGNIDGLLIRI